MQPKLQNPSSNQVVQPSARFVQAINNDLVVTTTVRGINAMSRFKIAQSLQRVILMMKDFNKAGVELARFGRSG